jgi:hypothetical protein
MATASKARTIKNPVGVKAGDVWERRNGSTFTIDWVDRKYVYWLSSGSHPQYRSISLENLQKRYRRITT